MAGDDTYELRGKVLTSLGVVAQKWQTTPDGHGELFVGWYLGHSPITEDRARQLIREGHSLQPAPPPDGRAEADGPRPNGAMSVARLRELLAELPSDLTVTLEIPGQRAGAPLEVDLASIHVDATARQVQLTYRRDDPRAPARPR